MKDHGELMGTHAEHRQVVPTERTSRSRWNRLRRQRFEAGDALELEAARVAVASSLFAGLQPKSVCVGRYVLRRRIGAGGMGVVFCARDPSLERDVAVKLLNTRSEASRADDLLLREARKTARLVHPNVVTIFDVGMHEGRVLGEQLVSKVGIGAPDNMATTFVPDLEGGTGLELMPYPSNPRPFSFRCVGRQVVLTQNGRSPVDNGGLFPADHDANREISPPFVLTEPQSPGYVVRKTGCEGKSGTCVSHFGSGFVQTERELCGWFDSREVLTCKKQLEVPVSMHVPQGWYIEEVESFRHALDFEEDPVIVAPLVSDSGIASSLATFGRTSADKLGAASVTVLANSAKLAGPLYGAMFSIAFDTATGELVWVENANHGLFVRAALGTIGSISGLAIGDLDGDGDGDLVATSASSEIVAFSNPLRSPSVE